MKFYPPKISKRFYTPENAGKAENCNAVGTGASFVCGTFVRFRLDIDTQTKKIRKAKFKSNGCGFAIAAADVLTEKIVGRHLTKLHGFDKVELETELNTQIENFPDNRTHCREMCFDALQSALADFRAFQIEEFTGEKALICTCFAVSEDEIEKVIIEHSAETIEDVSAVCNAGTGCGSCQFLIQELIDIKLSESV